MQNSLTPAQQKLNTESWGKLIQDWKNQGVFAGSSLITKPGVLISGPEREVNQGFVADADFRVVSIIRVTAVDMEAAVDMAKLCPPLNFGGTVEIREAQPSPFSAT
ncbi:hypothetical protein GCM10028774_26010 [Spirosoma jeollabukense]